MSSPTPLKSLILIYPNFNTLDMSGPLDVLASSALLSSEAQAAQSLSNSPSGSQTQTAYINTLASATEFTRTFENLSIRRDLPLSALLAPSEILGQDLPAVAEYDLLLVPGGGVEDIERAMASGEMTEVVRKFVETASVSASKGRNKWLVSVCTGALVLGSAGVLAGKTATTHWKFLDRLKGICEGQDGEGTEVVRKRFVDCGKVGEGGGVRLLTAGGVSCGIDAAVWMVREEFGVEAAARTVGIMDYRCEFVEGAGTTEGYVVPSSV